MDLDMLKKQLATTTDPQEAKGLKAFIAQAEKLGPDVTIMGKIMQSPLVFGDKSKIAGARTFDDLKNAFGPNFTVKLEKP
ncbi:hypothetical protein [Dyella subtropica]|uniref:hypothetical protein n=1 Tax=Dyella subtropica TaxID=2992127 RepID=UPI00225165F8|nr:hypothetical protein [Dyella subtropica]